MQTALIVLTYVSLAVMLQTTVADTANAQDSTLSVEVVPNSVELSPLSPNKEAKVFVKATNISTDSLQNVQLSTFSNAGVTATPQGEQKAVQLAPGEEQVWQLAVKQTGEGPLSGTVQLRIDYDRVKEDSPTPIPQTVFGSLETKSSAPTTVDAVAEAQVRTTLTTLSRERPGKAFLTIRNKSDVPLRLEDISVRVPGDIVAFGCEEPELITTDCAIKGGTMSIAPNENRTIAINLWAENRVIPGKYLSLFEIPLKWGSSDTERSGELVVTHEFNVEVFGESQILTLLGVPLLLVLPGFLVVGTWSILWPLYPLKPKEEIPAFPLAFATPGFWIVALTISIVLVFFYSFTLDINFLQSYGLLDIGKIWSISALLGILSYFAVRVILKAYRARRVPSEQDKPISVLRKLKRQGLGISLNRVKVEANGELYQLFLLEPNKEDDKKISAGPYIVVRWKEVDGRGKLGEQRRLREQVRENLRLRRDPESLAKLLKKGNDKDVLEVRWDRSKAPSRPMRLKKEDIKDWLVEPDIILVTE